jgi:hypothetical protein
MHAFGSGDVPQGRRRRSVAGPAFGLALAGVCFAPAALAGFVSPPPGFIPVPPALTLEAPREPSEASERVPVAPPVPAGPYGALDRGTCEAELGRRGVPFDRVDEARGVRAPIRLTGPVRGVTFTSMLPASQRATSPLEILDCRLGLALDDFAAQLAAHDIVEVVHFSMYRPPPRGWPAEKTGARHSGALAIDAATFVKRDGRRLDVLRDFHGRIGATPCGPGAGPQPSTPDALELRQIFCDAAGARLFNVALTPDFNWPHRNHFHLEVSARTGSFYVR